MSTRVAAVVVLAIVAPEAVDEREKCRNRDLGDDFDAGGVDWGDELVVAFFV